MYSVCQDEDQHGDQELFISTTSLGLPASCKPIFFEELSEVSNESWLIGQVSNH